MKGLWQSYQNRSNNVVQDNDRSIAKDELTLLAERLEFFAPRLTRVFTFRDVTIYLLLWTLFMVGLRINTLNSWREFITLYLVELLVMVCTVLPILFLSEIQQDSLREMRPINACIRVLMMAGLIAGSAVFMILMVISSLAIVTLTPKDIVFNVVIHTINVTGFTTVFLIYYLQRHRELKALQRSFEQRLATQNDHIKARLAPHFFFNTINTLSTLVDIDPPKASDMLHHVSMLFRSSFSEPKETSFEEELELCRHYLAIEKYRLQNKLKVVWRMPDEDVLYDMTITSLTLQNVLEQTILHVVEMTTSQVNLEIKISWENHMATIVVTATLPEHALIVQHNIDSRIQFQIQKERLQYHFGEEAKILTTTQSNAVTTIISYPLHDAFIP